MYEVEVENDEVFIVEKDDEESNEEEFSDEDIVDDENSTETDKDW